ncbi:MAG: enolase C-terminal domain-like protein [Kiritimatiellae bacterium]|nr:enolase C-terminal domain-like protein [Kiritimatiellia bacterium]
MSLRIEKVSAHIVQMPCGFTYSEGSHKMSRAVIWEIAAGGHVGIGECRFPTDEADVNRLELTPAACRHFKDTLALTGIASALIGKSAYELEALLPDLTRRVNNEQTVIREGLSIALYDLVGKARGLPVHTLLGGKRRSRVPGMPVLHTYSVERMVRSAQAWVNDGYRFLKIKPPLLLEEAIAVLRGIRQAVGPEISIQFDTNQGYKKFADAESAIRALEPFKIDIYEDILDAPMDQLAELRRRTGVKIMYDFEASWQKIYEICRADAADIINQHPNNQGGLAVALQIATVAAAAGIPTAIGSSGRFGIQDAAFQMLSSVIGLPRPCEDIGFMPYYNCPAKGNYTFDREPSLVKKPYPIVNGVIHIPDDPGLGIELDRERLKLCTVDTVSYN